MNTVRVAVTGALGRMGQEVVKMVVRDPELTLAAAIDAKHVGEDIGEILGLGTLGVKIQDQLEIALLESKAKVMVDFTTPHVVKRNMEVAIASGVHPVVGTTGLSHDELSELDKLCRESGISALVAPNFAIGAVLMMKFSEMAAKYMPHVEIIELHHDQKLDAPSGTAIKTAELIRKVRNELKQGQPNEKELIEGSRGGYMDGFRIHSVRLPGLVAHQEVIFGSLGQTLTIRHDSIHREGFMPGVNLAIKKVMELHGLVYGLENIMD
ncbi:4-hydroxy-tetrahydrodipicolinate reductase [Microaerobacter geothermalis]|nr:4-hydroxy-tetrahydrodipicolinate reductase [Microaerobacter geothermalis]